MTTPVVIYPGRNSPHYEWQKEIFSRQEQLSPPTLASLLRRGPSHKIVNHQPDMMIHSSVRNVGSLGMHRKPVGTVMVCLQISEEEVVVEEEAVGHIEDVDVVVNIRTPHQSLKVHHLYLNLN